jgi:hypothetical protein
VAVRFLLLAGYIAAEAAWTLAAGDRAEISIAGLVLTAGMVIFDPALGIAKRRRAPGSGRRAGHGRRLAVRRRVATGRVRRRWRASRGVRRCRVAAGEQQRQLVVSGDGAAIRLGGPLLRGLALLSGAGALAAQVVGRAAPRDRDDPATGIGRKALTRPLLQGRRARLLRAVLCQRQVTRDPRHRRRGPPRSVQGPFGVLAQCGPITISGRTSTDPYLADGIAATYRSAVSRSSQSRM